MPLREIRAFIDERYGKFGLSTPTLRPAYGRRMKGWVGPR
jgi:hypothetical protein